MDRFNFYRGQVVGAVDMDAAFAALERQLWDRNTDIPLFGIVSGLAATLGTAPNLNVAKGIAYDQLGRRLRAYTDGASTKSHSYATTTAGSSTSVTTGLERWISVYARYGQKGSDPRLDSGVSVNFQLLECLNSNDTTGGVDKLYIIMGSSASTGTATRPALETDKILLCDIKRTPSDASNVIDFTRVTTGPFKATSIQVSALTAWAGGRTNPATTLQAALDRYITDLAAQTASDDGCERVGGQASGSIPVGSLRSALDFLDGNKASLSANQTWTGEQLWNRSTPATQFVHRYPQTSGLRLISGVDGAGSTDGGVRIYVEGNGRLYLTTNAEWDGSKWNKDVTTDESMTLIVGALSGGTKHHLAICWRIASASQWDNTFGISTGWSRILDISGTDGDWLGGSTGGLGAGVGATLLEVQKGEFNGNVNGVNSDVYWAGAQQFQTSISAGDNMTRIVPFRRKWNATPTAGTVNGSPASPLISPIGATVNLHAITAQAFSWFEVPHNGWGSLCATVTFSI